MQGEVAIEGSRPSPLLDTITAVKAAGAHTTLLNRSNAQLLISQPAQNMVRIVAPSYPGQASASPTLSPEDRAAAIARAIDKARGGQQTNSSLENATAVTNQMPHEAPSRAALHYSHIYSNAGTTLVPNHLAPYASEPNTLPVITTGPVSQPMPPPPAARTSIVAAPMMLHSAGPRMVPYGGPMATSITGSSAVASPVMVPPNEPSMTMPTAPSSMRTLPPGSSMMMPPGVSSIAVPPPGSSMLMSSPGSSMLVSPTSSSLLVTPTSTSMMAPPTGSSMLVSPPTGSSMLVPSSEPPLMAPPTAPPVRERFASSVDQNVPLDWQIPNVQMTVKGQKVTLHEALYNRKGIIFGVPGAFTPVCSQRHVPGFRDAMPILREAVEYVACVAVNDPYVLKAWAKELEIPQDIVMISDWEGKFTEALGLEMDASSYHMGIRCRRFCIFVSQGTIVWFGLENDAFVDQVALILHKLNLLTDDQLHQIQEVAASLDSAFAKQAPSPLQAGEEEEDDDDEREEVAREELQAEEEEIRAEDEDEEEEEDDEEEEMETYSEEPEHQEVEDEEEEEITTEEETEEGSI
eukprot:Blabericola_migrator_1__12293@NODE_768_length_6592_cov_139_084138_g546_i0_p2_GENE_NODE_768_length_6592_cov_139_084138_g546_i0NODE_768_length_6592_cov_139_084138_g546_i0_p2_ORF_typecomplete_len576_score90_69Redoxin/PF08534_10/2_9e20AhpCTSA/PF00578_21/1_1e07LAP1C/PF05609_12/0_0095Borrelia_P83/PF05262_11/0_039SDA1/PF05285_12/4_7SMC_N/PF02463_19/10U79_P34/PF03064_16/13_NODE_768_length_6592_cov_139_084138_g546_i0891816